jgi:hypothetical protein
MRRSSHAFHFFIYECGSIFPIRDQCAATSTNVMTNARVSIIERAQIASKRKKTTTTASDDRERISVGFHQPSFHLCQISVSALTVLPAQYIGRSSQICASLIPLETKTEPSCVAYISILLVQIYCRHISFSLLLLLPLVPYKVSLNALLSFFSRATKKFQRLAGKKRGDSSTHRNKSECLFE